MCGIFGTLNYTVEDPEQVFQSLYHRGPDGRGYVIAGAFSVWHTRLAIQELGSGGQQPMQRGRWILAFNGEIYNHHELRQQYGLICVSGSDTETLLLLWERIGVTMFPLLDGMFAVALFDTIESTLWLARDRFGEKPLYVWQEGRQLAFSSELRALQQLRPLSINRDSLSRYCQVGYFLPGETPYRDVRMVQPGFVERIDAQTLACVETRWVTGTEMRYSGTRVEDAPTKATELIPALNQVLTQSIHRQLDSADREVGVLLSGGIDSGLVTAIAAGHRSRIRTFTMSFPNGLYDEAPLARLVAKRYQTQHTEIRLDDMNLSDEVLKVLPHYGEPFMDSSALPSYWVAKAAREYVSVVLTGDGADELFGGYRRYVPASLGLYQIPQPMAQLLRVTHPFLPHPTHKQSRYSHLYRLIALAHQSGPSRYLSATTDVFGGYESALLEPASLVAIEERIKEVMGQCSLQQLQELDQTLLLPGNLLKKMDIATMAHGLEARNPFLSKEVSQFAFSLPDRVKIGWQSGCVQTKWLLRQLARQYLPSPLIDQPKRGFEVPLRQWLDGPLRELMHDYLATPTLIDTLIEPNFIHILLHKLHQFSPEKRAKMLWMMLSVEVWHRNLYPHG